MPFKPAICTQCGARINIDSTTGNGICNYCGTAFVLETGGANNKTSQIKRPDSIERTEKHYKIRIKREKKFSGCAVDFVFHLDDADYILHNGGDIQIETNIKNINMRVQQQAAFGKGDPFIGRFTAVADGNDINVKMTMGPAFNKFTVRVISSSNRTVAIK